MAMKKGVPHFLPPLQPSLTNLSYLLELRKTLQVQILTMLELKKFKQGILTFYVLKRLNFQYIFWDKADRPELQLYSMVEMLHYQLMSCFTSKVNNILETNQTYDPTINFGKGRSAYNLLQFSIENGLHSLPVLFDSLPILMLSNSNR